MTRSHALPERVEKALRPAVAPSEPPSEFRTRSAELVERIRRGDVAAAGELYQRVSTGLRFLICRQLGLQDADDKVHDTFLVILDAIRRNQIRNPACLMGFARTVVQRQVVAHIRSVVVRRSREVDVEYAIGAKPGPVTPEQKAIRDENTAIMREVLLSLSPRDRELLTRFYLEEQPAERIIDEMGLTPTQFRLLKSRAKARFGELGQRRLHGRPPARPARDPSTGLTAGRIPGA